MDRITPEVLEIVESIDFGCGFIDGKCVAVDRRNATASIQLDQICCRACHHNIGYLKTKEAELPAEYQPYFFYPNGFLTETGCGLPIEMRSHRCVIYVCKYADIADSDRAILVNFEKNI